MATKKQFGTKFREMTIGSAVLLSGEVEKLNIRGESNLFGQTNDIVISVGTDNEEVTKTILSANEDNVEFGISTSNLNLIGNNVTINGSELASQEDVTSINEILIGADKTLVSPSLTGTWTIYDANDNVLTTRTDTTISYEYGHKVSWSGSYSWTTGDENTTKNPKTYTTTGFDTNVTGANVNPSGDLVPLTINKKTSGITGKVTQYSDEKKMLKVTTNNEVKIQGGLKDSKSASVGASFFYYSYCGYTTTIPSTASEITTLATRESRTNNDKTWNGVQTSEDQYVVYAFPSELGTITSIILDGATPSLGAFTKSDIKITNSAGKEFIYYVYTSNNPGAFKNTSKLVFS